MAVVGSGRMRLNGDVVKEFGGTAPDRASEYYRAPAGALPNELSTTVVTPNYVPGNSKPGNIIPGSGMPCCKISSSNSPCPDTCRRCCSTYSSGAGCTCFAQANPPTTNPGYWTTTSNTQTFPVNQGVPKRGTIKWSNWYGTRGS